MKVFLYQDNHLHVENCAIEKIAASCQTPFYVYSASAMRQAYTAFEKSVGGCAKICFAVKANSNQAILTLLAGCGAGADIVSEGEARRALAAGIPAEKIYFSGAGKSLEELRFVLEAGIGQINIESSEEFERLCSLMAGAKQKASIAFRVNPDIKAGGHDKISTGKSGDKFGMSLEEAHRLYQKASGDERFKVKGLAVHIGSQIFEPSIFIPAWEKLGALAETLRAENMKVEKLDLGGGLGVSHQRNLLEDIRLYGEAAKAFAEKYDCALVLSPGRAIVGAAGALVVSVIEEKKAGGQNFLILDGAMNDLIRPTLYDVNHPVLPVRVAAKEEKNKIYQLAGPICESGDILGRDIALPQQQAGSLIAITEAGAYGAVLSSNYNSRLLVPEVIVQGEQFAIARARKTYQELIDQDAVPQWIREE
jgi:diaminopimelate decarboxylase